MNFSTDGFWAIIGVQLVNQSVQIFVNKAIALRFKEGYFFAGVAQLLFDFIL